MSYLDYVFEFQSGAWHPTIRLTGYPNFLDNAAEKLIDQGLFYGQYFFDLATGDCNGNNVDDRCESIQPIDCNANGITDVCEFFPAQARIATRTASPMSVTLSLTAIQMARAMPAT